MPGKLFVGRVTQAFYRKMGIEDLVVHSTKEYVSKAVQVATDREYRRYVTGRIAARSDVVFNDLEAVREHERFFEETLCHVK
jgi:predicted O-linked N-acetylglucosamine transferase (SPINDLY family)